MRCPDCNKFVEYDREAEPEENSADYDEESKQFTASYRRVLPCAECGTELKEAEIEFDVMLDPEEKGCEGDEDADKDVSAADRSHEWELDDSSAEATEDMKRTDRHGKPIKSARYMKTLYGVEVSVTLKCKLCGETHEEQFTESVAASDMEELV